ncbi:CDGSH iron-sulfur domain-containing protein [Aquimarina sp. 2201CG5-10]|uniref:CDGSH iron-sulfur domain-containing protein n=1 Tax=Aquimarina callyspongiae TaxID=3098150 RepID=UPI002AB3BF55|nr:CDGSH iron-sulfur domain-containing protein [Aquimarina sp. 2201CG5-10]MDY8138215.1 CDGSH iron-sulfur domain-containing protein [Aquimarina sp. 2201CG5-10]
MENNIRGGDAPIPCQLEADKNYAWCSCGHSTDQPFCNGTHKKEGGTPPMIFSIEESKEAYLCTCKQTNNPPYCDGSHNK